jgi:hypothetical protein
MLTASVLLLRVPQAPWTEIAAVYGATAEETGQITVPLDTNVPAAVTPSICVVLE